MARQAYDPSTDRPLTRDHCFLCGVVLTDQNRTDEHVFPRWLQKDFELWDARLNLLNGTSIPYRQLKIPCCSDCNAGHLGALEQEVQLACRQGPGSFCSLDRSRIYQWLLKMFYGVMFQEVFLVLDRKDPDSGSILPREFFEEFNTCHSISG